MQGIIGILHIDPDAHAACTAIAEDAPRGDRGRVVVEPFPGTQFSAPG